MKLFYSPNSPYARKVRVVLHELAMVENVEIISCSPFDDPPELRKYNKLGKVPALVLSDETVLFDSPVICEYLDSLSGNKLIPKDGDMRWSVLRAQALADGVMDIAVGLVLEKRRKENERSPSSMQRWREQILSAVGSMPDELKYIPKTVNLGSISMAVALAYLDFRHADLDWRGNCDKSFVDWVAEFARAESMLTTAPS